MLRRTVLAARLTATRPALMLQASRVDFAKHTNKPQRTAEALPAPEGPPDATPVVEDPCLVAVDVPQTKCAFDPNRPNPLDALAAHVYEQPTQSLCFRRVFDTCGRHKAEKDCRTVLLLTGPDTVKTQLPGECELGLSRFSAARRVVSSLRSEWNPTWSKLLIISGPARSGKTHLGLFGLANSRRLTIHIRTASLLQGVGGTDTVAKCMAAVALHQRLADDPDAGSWARDDAEWAVRRYYKEALVQHLLDLVEQRVGKRSARRSEPVPSADMVRVILFFDDFDCGSEGVRRAVLDIASAHWRPTLPEKLDEHFGFILHGIAVAGTRLVAADGAIQDPTSQLTVSAVKLNDRSDDNDRVMKALLPLIQGPASFDEAAARCGVRREWSKYNQKSAAAVEAQVRELSSMPLFTYSAADADELAALLAGFLRAACNAGWRLPLAQFAAVLNDMFSHSTQLQGDLNDLPLQPPATAMRVPAGLETHTLSGCGASLSKAPRRRDGLCDLTMHQVLKTHKCPNDTNDAYAAVQLVLQVGVTENVTFNFRCFVPSLAETNAEFLERAHAQRHAAAMKGGNENALAVPASMRNVYNHGGFIPVIGLRHGPCWMGDAWYVKVPDAEPETEVVRSVLH